MPPKAASSALPKYDESWRKQLLLNLLNALDELNKDDGLKIGTCSGLYNSVRFSLISRSLASGRGQKLGREDDADAREYKQHSSSSNIFTM